jgi:hypothetical protein
LHREGENKEKPKRAIIIIFMIVALVGFEGYRAIEQFVVLRA